MEPKDMKAPAATGKTEMTAPHAGADPELEQLLRDRDALKAKLKAQNAELSAELKRAQERTADALPVPGARPPARTLNVGQPTEKVKTKEPCFLQGQIRKAGWEGMVTKAEAEEYCDKAFDVGFNFGGERHSRATDAQPQKRYRAVRVAA